MSEKLVITPAARAANAAPPTIFQRVWFDLFLQRQRFILILLSSFRIILAVHRSGRLQQSMNQTARINQSRGAAG
jgi:hypothetical protein